MPPPTFSAAGGGGAIELAEKVVAAAAEPATPLKPLYPLDWPAEKKIEQIARIMYGAAEVNILPAAAAKIKKAAKLGYGRLPICMAKTQDSLSDNPKLRGRPRGFTLTVRDVEIAAGAGFLVALTGDIVRMPGLPERPAAERIDVDPERADRRTVMSPSRSVSNHCHRAARAVMTAKRRRDRPVHAGHRDFGRPLLARQQLAVSVEQDHRRVELDLERLLHRA